MGRVLELAQRVLDRAVESESLFHQQCSIGHICYPYPEAMQQKRGEYGAGVFLSSSADSGDNETEQAIQITRGLDATQVGITSTKIRPIIRTIIPE